MSPQSASSAQKIAIPYPSSSSGSVITGILQSKQTSSEGPRRIALILHGVMGHKDYLHQRKLALELEQDSFRFDFRGNHESPGDWSMGHFENDIDDLVVVSAYLRETLGYEIDMVIGHSRGAIAAAWWLTFHPTELSLRQCTRFVHLCGRYRMERIHDKDPLYDPFFLQNKPFPWTVRVAGQTVTAHITPDQVESFAKWNNSYAIEHFPTWVHVLNVGGGKDTVVPPWDAFLWQRAYQKRAASASLHLFENADHNLLGFHEEVVSLICDWSGLVQRTGTAPPVWDPNCARKSKQKLVASSSSPTAASGQSML